ncbi:hypothetical protein FOZ61_010266 [Perkinsus olseni]|uniref:Uncharacterized protein n=1 Tax=Perkinsus olseni TaxID=32597 RepID=A0A7J6KWT3_PEROL|nr:hypothetical protein FOZ61_010266 [Perkinsus olseni]
MATNAAVADMSSSYAPCVLGAWFCGTAFSFIFSMVVRALSDTSSYTSALTSFTVIVVATAAIAGVLTETPSDTSKPRRAITSIIIGTLVASAACHISVTFLLPTIAVGVPEVGLFGEFPPEASSSPLTTQFFSSVLSRLFRRDTILGEHLVRDFFQLPRGQALQ